MRSEPAIRKPVEPMTQPETAVLRMKIRFLWMMRLILDVAVPPSSSGSMSRGPSRRVMTPITRMYNCADETSCASRPDSSSDDARYGEVKEVSV
eukprot:1563977-Rhodomonas_salina.2